MNVHLLILLTVGWCASADKPVWFVQLTDTHISDFEDPGRVDDLRFFLEKRLLTIAPKVVVLSGDITHGVTRRKLGRQSENEWKTYRSLLRNAKLDNPEFWIDVRGNHDAFRVHSWNSDTNYYRKFSTIPLRNGRFHTRVIHENNKNYVISTIDTTLEPGLGRRLNFYGIIPEHQLSELSEFVNNSTKMATGGAPVFVGHHPVIYVHTKQQKSFRSFLSVGAYYLCGHLHTGGGLISNMYYKHSPKLVELELGDWKDNRLYRIAAWDQGRFSFVDVSCKEPIALLVTNPKLPGLSVERETNTSMSQEVRMLIFSFDSPISEVTVHEGSTTKQARQPLGKGHPLWTVPWSLKQSERITLSISIRLSDGTEYHKPYDICLGCDGYTYGFGAKLALDFIRIDKMYMLYIVLLGTHISTLILFRYYTPSKPVGHLNWCHRQWNRFRVMMNRLCSLTVCFAVMLLSDVYSILGPWVIGELTDAKFGLSFVWGTVVGEDHLPADILVVFASQQLIFIQFPFMFALGALLNWRVNNNGVPIKAATRKYVWLLSNITLCYTIILSGVIAADTFSSFPYFILLSWLTVYNPWLLIAMWLYVLLTPVERLRRGMEKQASIKPH